MESSISKGDIPSIKYKDIWKDSISYNEIIEIIHNQKEPYHANQWISNFRTKFNSYLEEYVNKLSDKNPQKHCRDLYYLLEDVIHKIKFLPGYDKSYDFIKKSIKNTMDTELKNNGYILCVKDAFNEFDINYNEIYIKNKKKIDDLCENINYTNKNYGKINNSSECAEIKKHIDHQYEILREVHNSNPAKYSDVLAYYEFTSFNDLENIIKKIQCVSGENLHASAQGYNSDGIPSLSGVHIFLLLVLSLFGSFVPCFFLYKPTPLGLWLRKRIGNEINFFNKINYEKKHRILGDISEYLQDNLHNEEYNVFHHSSGD
ncbi:PIR Superfamily Protein [Plasmodium ovale curtisi]|uniref:PIR Superfamily Protein n=1 Tax=Plasmodium ovale curtisi TaxID=864141 RepID=A0A1A8WR00_PLAOA|nr:PIR Superfamily Protein [Plasmodium ovale curtisi]